MTETSTTDGWAGVIKGKPQVGQSAERSRTTSLRDDKPICTLNISVRDGSGDICVDGTAVTYTMPLLGL